MDDQQNPTANPQAGDGGSPSGPATPPESNPGQSGDHFDWKGRYEGAQRVLSQKAKEINQLQEQLSGANEAVQSLQQQLQNSQAQWDTQRQGLEGQLANLTGERDQHAQKVSELSAYQVKMQALSEFPELFPLADSIPSMPDLDAMKEHLRLLQGGVDKVAQQKAERLSAGMTPGPTAPSNQPQYHYSTQAEWQDAMNGAAGTSKFQDVSDAYLRWAAQQSGA